MREERRKEDRIKEKTDAKKVGGKDVRERKQSSLNSCKL